jgi:uncharacterized membrane protein YeaQ/YmgE (transglycosylase-associated protein family)
LIGLLWTVIIGGIVGWLASVFMKANAQMGVLLNIVVGIAGSALGFFLAGLIGIAAYGLVGRIVVSTLGAMLLIALLRGLRVLR